MYTSHLGSWAGTIVGISALVVMFTTLLTVLDGFPRLLATGIAAIRSASSNRPLDIENSVLQRGCVLFLAIGAALVLLFLMGSFQTFIDFVTVTAFVVSPVTAVLNHLVMFSSRVPDAYRPTAFLKSWSVLGIVTLSALSAMFLYVRFF